jgi:hypothetical protein
VEDAQRSSISSPPTPSLVADDRFRVQKGLSEADPELWIRLRPNASMVKTVLGRQVVQEVDAYGCRPVLGQPSAGDKTLAAYGCSHTFGTALSAEETFCSLLQGMFPKWRVENHGTGSYGSTQSLIQLRRDTRWEPADYVTFCWIPSHLIRNVAEISWLQGLMKNMSREIREGRYPRAALDGDGNLDLRWTRFPRWELMGLDLTDFRPDRSYLDLVASAIFRRAREIVTQSGGHFFVTVLNGQLSTSLRRSLDAVGIPVVDASLNHPRYTCQPDDGHPNALANRIYAEKIRDYLAHEAAT